MRSLATALILALCAAITATQAEIYKWTDANGKVHYSDAAPAEQRAETLSLDQINTFTDVSISDAPDWAGFYQPERKQAAKNVLIYTTATCGFCRQAVSYFNSQGIRFTEKKIDSDTAAWEEYQQLGADGVPVILVGRKRMDGFSQSSFDQLYYGDRKTR